MRAWSVLACLVIGAGGAGTCTRRESATAPGGAASAAATAPAAATATASARASAPAAATAAATAAPDAAPPDPIDEEIANAPTDPMAIMYATPADLLKLVVLPPIDDPVKRAHRDTTLAYLVAPAPGHFNQGNPAKAHHAISRKQCLEGLKGVTIQTDAQREVCGAPNMVPIYTSGDPASAKVCIDVFEFPNQACELPFVWGSPLQAEYMCKLEGKRLCQDKEWNLACAGDPLGGKPWAYAYGDKLDMTACHDDVPKRMNPDGKTWECNTHDAQATWATCATDTEPSGSFPRCRSRMGVFDQHGNVAEEMFRKDGEAVWTQLKGSAWFYVDVGREPGKPAWHPDRESYPDTCNYDPRWHVEELKKALHVNYHLGFRCCKDVVPETK